MAPLHQGNSCRQPSVRACLSMADHPAAMLPADQGVLPVRQVTPTEKQQINAFLNAQAARIEEERRKRRQSAGVGGLPWLPAQCCSSGCLKGPASALPCTAPFVLWFRRCCCCFCAQPQAPSNSTCHATCTCYVLHACAASLKLETDLVTALLYTHAYLCRPGWLPSQVARLTALILT